jgi:hypothetical protein
VAALLWLAGAVHSGTATAHSDDYTCRTDYMSSSSYTYCDYRGGYSTVTVCHLNTGNCTTREQ